MLSLDKCKEKFQIESFRGHQEDIILHTLAKKNSLVLMPTGGGKSLCYQAPIFLSGKLGIIISPLISLMKDQVQKLRGFGENAHYLNSTLDYEQKKEVHRDIVEGECRYLYVAPETALKKSFIRFIQSFELSLIAIDESHCISSWGSQFRPEYKELKNLISHFPGTPVMALTATANIQTRKDILINLGIENASIFTSSFDRPNIHLQFQKNIMSLSNS